MIEPEDFNFYEKIKVPPPTFCPECRTIRRLCWRNEMSLFKRKCDAPGHQEMVVSFYHPDEKLVIYDNKYWWGDGWDSGEYGKDYDFSLPFFTQWRSLLSSCPMQALSNSNAINSDFCNVADGSKNSYMCSGSWYIENTLYSNRILEIKDSLDLHVVYKSELCYECVYCTDCYHTLYSLNCKNCVDSYFLYDCHGCVNCFGCSNLRNKSYCLWNKQLSKEKYFEEISKLDLTDHKVISEIKSKFKDLYISSIHKFANLIKVINSSGNNLEGAKNCKVCFDLNGTMEDLKYTHWGGKATKDAYDSGPGIGSVEVAYEAFDTGVGGSNNLFTSVVYGSNNVEYSFNCYNCSNIFGCIGLRSKNYCILNKQYSKEEYEKLIPKIKEHMISMPYIDAKNRVYKYGEFFPAELSPFCYNETQAQDYFPTTKEKVLGIGYRWRDRKNNEYKVTIKSKDLPLNLKDVTDSILNEVIECENLGTGAYCRGAFKITKDELILYRKIGIPLPRFCFFCRHEKRLKQRNPLKLWHRSCMCQKEGHDHTGKCLNEFETSYAPERPEIIYCERCYQKEVY
jgi:hypothetical protein